MKKPKLPPLNALRAFEATARHLSVKIAAEELCVSPGAVSQMLKGLELKLGVTLFKRTNRRVFLTDAGQNFLPPVHSAFRQISDATARVATVSETGTLTVSMTASFASSWLVPRLKQFRLEYPEIDLQIHTGKALVDFNRDGVDAAIRHGLGRYQGLRSDRLFAIEVIPVAAPSLVRALGRPCDPAELATWPQIHDAERKDWHLWLRAQGAQMIGPPRGPAFDDSGLILRAALDGQGVALLPAAIVMQEISEGRLVRLADVVWPDAYAYYLLSPEESHGLPKVAAFRDWILKTAQPSDASVDQVA